MTHTDTQVFLSQSLALQSPQSQRTMIRWVRAVFTAGPKMAETSVPQLSTPGRGVTTSPARTSTSSEATLTVEKVYSSCPEKESLWDHHERNEDWHMNIECLPALRSSVASQKTRPFGGEWDPHRISVREHLVLDAMTVAAGSTEGPRPRPAGEFTRIPERDHVRQEDRSESGSRRYPAFGRTLDPLRPSLKEHAMLDARG